MAQQSTATITRDELARRLTGQKPDNETRRRGFALVSVVPEEQFRRAHIPGSFNMPLAQIDELERRFDHDKEIVVYCGSPQCDASSKAAARLQELGFRHVQEYEGGVTDWGEGGHRLVGSA